MHHCPLRSLSRKETKIESKPWLRKGLLKSISVKNKLFQKSFKQKNSNVFAQYKMYTNKLNILKRVAKRNYYKQESDEHKYISDMAKQWKTIHEITCHKKCHNDNPSNMTNSNNCMVTENADICKLLNDFFFKCRPFDECQYSTSNNKIRKYKYDAIFSL